MKETKNKRSVQETLDRHVDGSSYGGPTLPMICLELLKRHTGDPDLSCVDMNLLNAAREFQRARLEFQLALARRNFPVPSL